MDRWKWIDGNDEKWKQLHKPLDEWIDMMNGTSTLGSLYIKRKI